MLRTAFIAICAVSLLLGGVEPRFIGAQAKTDCPSDGTVRFAVEPFEASARIVPAYDALVKLISAKLGCPIELSIPSSYNAEIEAMRNGKLDFGEFGPLGYVLAHQVAHADAVATFGDDSGKPIAYFASIVYWRGSGITALKDVVNRPFAYSDPDLPPDIVKIFPAAKTTRFVPMPDSAYDGIRELVKTLHVDLSKLS